MLGPIYNKKSVQINTAEVSAVEKFLMIHANEIDTFLAGMPGLSDLKNIMYTYVNQTAKSKQLDQLSPKHFNDWLSTSKVSANKQAKIRDLATTSPNALASIFILVKKIQNMKDNILDQIESEHGEVWDTHGEGRVRYADQNKKFGHVKLVPRKRWTPQ